MLLVLLSNKVKARLSVCLFFLALCSPMNSYADKAEMGVIFKSSGEPAALLELYTSQGCSSCPPAERWFSDLAHNERLWKDLFPLAFHVDYWDYIGWEDPFASASYGVRQRTYAHFGHLRNVATPGFVYSGKAWNGWFSRQMLPTAKAAANMGQLNAKLQGKSLVIDFLLEAGLEVTNFGQDASAKVHVAVLGFDMLSDIKAGENRGRRLKQDFVVLAHRESFMNENEQSWSATMRMPEHEFGAVKQAVVIWVSKGKDPSPVQVAGGWL